MDLYGSSNGEILSSNGSTRIQIVIWIDSFVKIIRL